MVGELWRDFLTNPGRLIHKWKHYFPIYERHFEPFRNRPLTFIEIGCGRGGSLQMWKRYFGPFAQVVGLDCDPECLQFQEDQISVRVGDQADPAFLQSVLDEFGTPDIVLDDGSHKMTDIRASFALLYPAVAANGLYVVEDLHTAYWEQFGGGLGQQGSFIELCKGLIDELNGRYVPTGTMVTDFTRTTMSMHFYDSMVVIEKGRNTAAQSMASVGGTVVPG